MLCVLNQLNYNKVSQCTCSWPYCHYASIYLLTYSNVFFLSLKWALKKASRTFLCFRSERRAPPCGEALHPELREHVQQLLPEQRPVHAADGLQRAPLQVRRCGLVCTLVSVCVCVCARVCALLISPLCVPGVRKASMAPGVGRWSWSCSR